MIKVKVVQDFTLKDYKKIEAIEKADNTREDKFTIGDVLVCDEKMVDYLTGNNKLNLKVAEVLEVIPEVQKEVKKTTTKKSTKKTSK